MTLTTSIPSFAVAALLLAACGGGGGGDDASAFCTALEDSADIVAQDEVSADQLTELFDDWTQKAPSAIKDDMEFVNDALTRFNAAGDGSDLSEEELTELNQLNEDIEVNGERIEKWTDDNCDLPDGFWN